MQARFSEIKNFDLHTSDGPIGKVVDLLLDDNHWMVRYLVVAVTDSTSATAEHVLISPDAISHTTLQDRAVFTTLESRLVKESPLLDSRQPISRQHESALANHYGWPLYWVGQTLLHPQTLEHLAGDTELSIDEDGPSNLRSAAEICGYQILSRSGKAGVMNDLVINLRIWRVDNGVADPTTWLPMESSMFLTSHIESVDWSKREISVDLSREALMPVASQFLRSLTQTSSMVRQPTTFSSNPD